MYNTLVFFYTFVLFRNVFNVFQMNATVLDNKWGVFDEDSTSTLGKDLVHSSLSLSSTIHHCCLESERDVELIHRDLSTVALIKLLSQKGMLDKSTKEVKNKNTTSSADAQKSDGQKMPKDIEAGDPIQLEAKLGIVLWRLQASRRHIDARYVKLFVPFFWQLLLVLCKYIYENSKLTLI